MSYTVGLYMTVVDSTIIYTALPSVARDFHASLAAAQWVTLELPAQPGRDRPVVGLDRRPVRHPAHLPDSPWSLFTGASALCGLSGSLTQLVIFRVIQGVGGGLIIPVGQAMLFRTFPPERRARAAGMVALGTSLGPATGPVLGGVLTTYLSWRWCFFVNVPFGTVVLVIGLLFLAEHREPAAGRLDLAGFVLAGGGLALFLYALSESPVRGWASPVIIGTGAGRPGRAGRRWWWSSCGSTAPMLNLRLLRNRIFRTTSLVSLCQPGRLQRLPVHHARVPAAGPRRLGAELRADHVPGRRRAPGSAPRSPRALYPRIGPRRMAVGGLCGVIVVFCLIGLTVGLDTSIWLIRLLTFCSGSAHRLVRHRRPDLVVRDHLLGRHRPRVGAVPDPDPGRGRHRRGRAGHRRRRPSSPAGATGAALVPAFHHAFLTAAAIVIVAAA